MKAKTFFTFCLCGWAIGTGLRFIIGYHQGAFYPLGATKYLIEAGAITPDMLKGFVSPEFDIVFDWTVLLSLGMVVLAFNIRDYYKSIKGTYVTIPFIHKKVLLK